MPSLLRDCLQTSRPARHSAAPQTSAPGPAQWEMKHQHSHLHKSQCSQPTAAVRRHKRVSQLTQQTDPSHHPASGSPMPNKLQSCNVSARACRAEPASSPEQSHNSWQHGRWRTVFASHNTCTHHINSHITLTVNSSTSVCCLCTETRATQLNTWGATPATCTPPVS